MSKSIYVISYIPGMYGEFFCNQIANDNNFYSPYFSDKIDECNRFGYHSPIEEHYTFIGFGWPRATDETRELIDEKFADKNVVMRSHNYDEFIDVNLPRLKQVKFYCESDEWLYSLFLFLIKGVKPTATLNPDNLQTWWMIDFIHRFNQYPEYTETLLENVANITWMELDMVIHGLRTVDEYVDKRIEIALKQATASTGNGNWIYLNPQELLSSPEQHMSKWVEVFDLADSLNVETLQQYNANNIMLIEREFGKTYEELKTGDYRQAMIDYLQQFRLVF